MSIKVRSSSLINSENNLTKNNKEVNFNENDNDMKMFESWNETDNLKFKWNEMNSENEC